MKFTNIRSEMNVWNFMLSNATPALNFFTPLDSAIIRLSRPLDYERECPFDHPSARRSLKMSVFLSCSFLDYYVQRLIVFCCLYCFELVGMRGEIPIGLYKLDGNGANNNIVKEVIYRTRMLFGMTWLCKRLVIWTIS